MLISGAHYFHCNIVSDSNDEPTPYHFKPQKLREFVFIVQKKMLRPALKALNVDRKTRGLRSILCLLYEKSTLNLQNEEMRKNKNKEKTDKT